MIDETLEEKVSKLEARIEDLVTENEVQKALLLVEGSPQISANKPTPYFGRFWRGG